MSISTQLKQGKEPILIRSHKTKINCPAIKTEIYLPHKLQHSLQVQCSIPSKNEKQQEQSEAIDPSESLTIPPQRYRLLSNLLACLLYYSSRIPSITKPLITYHRSQKRTNHINYYYTKATMSFSRPSTPCSSISLPSVTNTTGARRDFVYHHNNDSDCCRTPTANMMPLMPHEMPLAPRPRKRVYDYDSRDSLATFAEHDLFMPTADSLMDRVAIVEDDDEDQVSLDYLPATPPRLSNCLALPHCKSHFATAPRRRKVDSTLRLAPSLADLDTTDVTPDNVVRISYRPSLESLEESLGLCKTPKDASNCDHQDETTTTATKLPPTRQARMTMLKRRNSYGAVCA